MKKENTQFRNKNLKISGMYTYLLWPQIDFLTILGIVFLIYKKYCQDFDGDNIESPDDFV